MFFIPTSAKHPFINYPRDRRDTHGRLSGQEYTIECDGAIIQCVINESALDELRWPHFPDKWYGPVLWWNLDALHELAVQLIRTGQAYDGKLVISQSNIPKHWLVSN